MKISIVTATYNSGSTIRDTLESVLRQDYRNYEHLIIDGQSKDNTIAICREYIDRYEGRLVIVSEPDKGIYDAMNKGLSRATGDIVGILNSDDFYSSGDVLSKVAEEFLLDKSDKLDAIYGDVHFVDSSDLTKCVRYYTSRFFRRWTMLMGYQPAHPSFYCKRECYEKYGSFDISYRIAADFENLLRLIFVHKIRIKYVPKDFVTMRIGGASTNGFGSYKSILDDHYRAYKHHGLERGYFLDIMRYPLKILELMLSGVLVYIYNFRR